MYAFDISRGVGAPVFNEDKVPGQSYQAIQDCFGELPAVRDVRGDPSATDVFHSRRSIVAVEDRAEDREDKMEEGSIGASASVPVSGVTDDDQHFDRDLVCEFERAIGSVLLELYAITTDAGSDIAGGRELIQHEMADSIGKLVFDTDCFAHQYQLIIKLFLGYKSESFSPIPQNHPSCFFQWPACTFQIPEHVVHSLMFVSYKSPV